MAVVCDLEQLEATFFDQHFYGRRSSIDRVLEEFFQCIHRGNDDLAGGDLVDDIFC